MISPDRVSLIAAGFSAAVALGDSEKVNSMLEKIAKLPRSVAIEIVSQARSWQEEFWSKLPDSIKENL